MFILLISFLSTVYASYWIYSNPITIISGAYMFGPLLVSNSNPTQYQNITFTGQLTASGGLSVHSKNITLFKDGVAVAWNLTDSFGIYTIHYNMTTVGTHEFKTGFEIP